MRQFKKVLHGALLGALFILAPLPSGAYITAAVLEYSAANRVDFYLNGHGPLKGRNSAEDHWLDYAVLDSADGSLPLSYFKNKSDNVLAADNWSLGPAVGLSFRLTLYQSSGDPIVIWSEPYHSKLLHLEPTQNRPENWFLPSFDDSAWPLAGQTDIVLSVPTVPNAQATPTPGARGPQKTPETGRNKEIPASKEFLAAELPDPHFRGRLGTAGFVPWISYNSNGWGPPMTHLFVRSHFRFPDTPDRVGISVNPARAVSGQKMEVRLQPGLDSASYASFKLHAYLPRELDLVQAPKGAAYDPATRRLTWSYVNQVKTLDLFLSSVLEAGGWMHPERALGNPKEGVGAHHLGRSNADVHETGAQVQSGLGGWFKLAASGMAGAVPAPRILGVMFHSQIKPRGKNGPERTSMDRMLFNYSVDGRSEGVLKPDKDVTTLTMDGYFSDGYYDATRDRAWTWEDIDRLRVYFRTVQRLDRKFDNGLASCDVTVSYDRPDLLTQSFWVQAHEAKCSSPALWAMVQDVQTNNLARDYVIVPLNQALCAKPSATPATVHAAATPLPTPVPRATVGAAPGKTVVVRVAPTATPAPALVYVPVQRALGLAGLQSNPEPFQRGGVFIYFSLKSEGNGTLRILQGTTPVRTLALGRFFPGNNQAFYNGLDDSGKAIPAGSYTYEVTVRAGSVVETRSGRFTRSDDAFKGL